MHSISELQQIKESILTELARAEKGEPSSFPYIRHSLSHMPLVHDDETFQVLVIGGSYFRNALLKKKDGITNILNYETGPLPTFQTVDDYYKFLEVQVYDSIRHVAINFAYPVVPIMRHDILDGILQTGSKEHSFEGMIDQTVGRISENHILHKKKRSIRVAVANDTICLLLSGLRQNGWDNLAAGIVGTGLNFAIFQDKFMVINLESANFNKFPQTIEGETVDRLSKSPGNAKYEKETSGGYLYQHFNIYIRNHGINHAPIKSTDELDFLARANKPEISELAQSFINHSAQLVGTQIAALLEYCKRDLTFIMQGSLYWNANQYKEKVEETVKQLTNYKSDYISIKDSDIYGAAALLTT